MRQEDRLQSRCRMILDAHLMPPCWWSSVGHERKQTPIQGAMQKARGVKRGLPDIMVWAPGYFLGVELKAGKNTATDAQSAFGEAMTRLGHGYALVRSVEHLGSTLEAHGIPLSPGWRVAAQIHDAALDAVAPFVAKKSARAPKPKPTRAQIGRANRMQLAMARGKS